MMADERLHDRLRELELALAVVEQECMRYQTLYHDTKKALDTLRAVRTQRVQDVAEAVEEALSEQADTLTADFGVQLDAAVVQAVREEREKHTFPFCEDSGHAICYQCAAAVRRPHEG
jgi:hypothetical protein